MKNLRLVIDSISQKAMGRHAVKLWHGSPQHGHYLPNEQEQAILCDSWRMLNSFFKIFLILYSVQSFLNLKNKRILINYRGCHKFFSPNLSIFDAKKSSTDANMIPL